MMGYNTWMLNYMNVILNDVKSSPLKCDFFEAYTIDSKPAKTAASDTWACM